MAYFAKIRWLISHTGLYVPPLDGKQWDVRFALGLLKAVCITLASLCYLIYGLTKRVMNGGESYALLWIMNSRESVSMCFLVYWQLTGGLERVYALFECRQLQCLIDMRYFMKVERIVVAAVVATVFCHVCISSWAVLYEILGVKPTSGVMFPGPAGLPYGYCLFTFIIAHVYCVGNVVFGFHALAILYVRRLFKEQADRLNALQPTEKDQRVEALNTEMSNYLTLSDTLHTLNDVFKMHVLARTMLTVPRLVLSLWYLQTTLPRSLEIVHVVHEIVKTTTDIVVLVIIPADVHSVIKEGETAVCRNASFWAPADECILLRTQSLLSMIRQRDFGVSLGGITTITTRLLWTLGSLLVTFLTVFSELRQAPGTLLSGTWNASNPMQMNAAYL